MGLHSLMSQWRDLSSRGWGKGASLLSANLHKLLLQRAVTTVVQFAANSSLPTTSRIWNTAVHNSITVMVAYCKTWHASSGMWFLFSQYELYWVILLLLWLFLQVVCNDILAKLFCLIAIISSVYMYTSLFIELLNPLSYLCIYTLQSGRFSCFAYTYT